MKKILQYAIILLSAFIYFAEYAAASDKKILPLVDENKTFWDMLLNEKSVNNKNLLYASYVSYKARLNDLSIETFQECIKTNSSNSLIQGISNYYIGKNLFLIGKYEEAITLLSIAESFDLSKYNYIKFAVLLNIAISNYQLGHEDKFRENLQKVISGDITGNYKKQALDLLSKVRNSG